MRLVRLGTEAVVVVLDVIRGYLSVAEGLTEISIERARLLAESLVTHSSTAADKSSEQISSLAEDLVKQSQTNRDLLIGLIRTEVDRTVGRMGFVREEELAAVRNHVHRLEAQVKAVQQGASGVAAMTLKPAVGVVSKVGNPAGPVSGAKSEAPTPVAQVEPTVQAKVDVAAPAPAATKAPAKKAPAKRAPSATKAPTKKAPAKRAPSVKKPPAAKKAPAKRAPAAPAPQEGQGSDD